MWFVVRGNKRLCRWYPLDVGRIYGRCCIPYFFRDLYCSYEFADAVFVVVQRHSSFQQQIDLLTNSHLVAFLLSSCCPFCCSFCLFLCFVCVSFRPSVRLLRVSCVFAATGAKVGLEGERRQPYGNAASLGVETVFHGRLPKPARRQGESKRKKGRE